jgi:hypothetical protein
MKKIFSKLVIGGLAVLSLAACSDDNYNDKYVDPSTTSTVGVPQVFTAVLYKGNTWMNPMYYRYYTQSTTSGTFSGVIGNSNERGRFRGASEGYFNTRWQNFYDMLTQYRLLEYTYNNLSSEEKPANEIFVHISRSVMQSQLHEMLSIFGSVPYSGAGTLWQSEVSYDQAKEKAVYDNDEATYKQILADLKESGDYFAAGNLDATGVSALTRQDYTLAAGDPVLWQKYINSLRLRIALHLATNGNLVAEAKTAIGEILGNPTKYPLIDNNDENMGVAASTKDDTFNFGKSLSQALRTGSYSVVSQTYLDALNIPANGVPDANTDPRVAVLLDPNPKGEYIAYDLTKTSTEISNLADEKTNEYRDQLNIPSSNYYAVIDTIAVAGWASYNGNTNTQGIWISAAEVSFSKAEAYLMGYGVGANAATAKTEFLKGMKQSTDYYWGIYENSSLVKSLGSDKYNDSYKGYRELTKPTDAEMQAYFESAWKGNQECICTQLWLNFGFFNELEAWNVVRRTGYPVVEFATDTQVSNYPTPPYRLPYPSDERNYNAANCQDAISKYYSESTGYYTNLFWAKQNYYTLVK